MAARQGDHSRARMFLAKVTDLDPDEPLGWLWRAGLAEEAEQALIWVNRALELDPTLPQARAALPKVRMQAALAVGWSGDFAMARHLFQLAAEADPKSILPWLELAALAPTPEETHACLEQVLLRDPNHAGARKCRAQLDAEHDAMGATPTPLSIEAVPQDDASDRLIPVEFDEMPDLDALPPAEPSRESTPLPSKNLPQPRRSIVMVIDDNDEVRDFVQRHLQSLGLRVIPACGADEATELLSDGDIPDLILLDGIMPYVDGYEYCNVLRHNADTAKTPIVLLARKDGWMPNRQGAMAGFNDVLGKPISPISLRELVAKYCPLLMESEKPASWPELPEEIMR